MSSSAPPPASLGSRVIAGCATPVELSTACGCMSLRAGVLLIAILFLVNASLAFAGEAALYVGLLTAIGEQASGTVLPPGTKINDPAVHSALIAVGIWTLIASIFGFISSLRRSLRATTAVFLQQSVDLFLAVAIVLITWLAGGSVGSVLAQIPGLLLNAYLLLITRSFRAVLMREAQASATALADQSGANVSVGGGALDGDDDDAITEADVGLGGVGGKPKTQLPGATATSFVSEDDDDDVDLDVPAPPPRVPGVVPAPSTRKGGKGV